MLSCNLYALCAAQQQQHNIIMMPNKTRENSAEEVQETSGRVVD
jgi:hypothetical protein